MKYPRTPLKTLIIAAAAILLGAPVALAASASSGSHHAGMSSSPMGDGGGELADASLMSQCTTLSKQFDQAQAAHKTDKNYKEALALGTEGKTLCRSGNKQAAGVKYLHSAMKMIGK